MFNLSKKSLQFRFGSIFILLTLFSGAPLPAFASDMYRWIDNEGRTHYSDRLPGEDAKEISKKEVPVAPRQTANPAQSESENPWDKYLEESRDERRKALEEKRRLAQEKRDARRKQQSREKCDKARAVVRLLEENVNGVVRRRSEDRPDVVSASSLSRSQIEDELEKWRKKVKKNCRDDDTFGTRVYDPKELPFSVPYY